MLSIFPSLFAFEGFAPFLIRVTLGVIFAYWSYEIMNDPLSDKQQKVFGIFEGLCGLFLIIGLFTQVVAILVSIYLIYHLVQKVKARSFFTDGINYYFILLIMALSLIVTGAGFISIDLPL